MANLSAENVARLKQLIADGVRVMQEVEDLKGGLSDTVKDLAEEMEVKPAILSRLIKAIHKGDMNERREASEILEELYKASGH
jgi:hypothetical protein